MNEPILLRILIYIVVGYITMFVIALMLSDKLLFVPQESGYKTLPHEVRIPTTDGETLNAVYLKNENAQFTLLFSHGNAEDLANVAPFMQVFYHMGFSVFMYDYRGYGTSDGTPSYRKIKDDATAAYTWLTEKADVAPSSIIAHGRSLGGAVAVYTAANHAVGGLIIESSFVSAYRVKTIIPLLPGDKFNSVKLLKKVQAPVLVIHGTDDGLLPLWHGKKLFKAAPEPKDSFWIEGGGHNSYAHVAGERYFETVSQFIKTHCQAK